jgi:hypothetical protein
MNYPSFTNDSLTMMYEGVRGALAADDALKRQGIEIRFRVRETPEWKLHAADLETEMLRRGKSTGQTIRRGYRSRNDGRAGPRPTFVLGGSKSFPMRV